MVEKTYKTSLAVAIQVTVDYNLTDATSTVFLVTKPDGTTVTWTPTVTNATTGVMSYNTIAGDLDIIGTYVLQPKVEFSGKKYFGDPVTFEVAEIIKT